jgi:hypothetical protein
VTRSQSSSDMFFIVLSPENQYCQDTLEGKLTDDTSVVDQDVNGTEGLHGGIDDFLSICD